MGQKENMEICESTVIHEDVLRRVREGSLELGDLPPGKWRRLTAEEVRSLGPHPAP